MKSKKKSVRLSGSIKPIHYRIFLHPDLEEHTFKGEETITLSVEKSTKEITLHSAELLIASATVLFGKEIIVAQKIAYDEKSETATFHFAKNIPKGKAKLSLAFSGVLKDNMRGFYKSRYVVDGKERFMATTQFEATDARRCIPCFDEPAQKAVFEVSLAVASDKTAISNTVTTGIKEHEAGYKIVSFSPSPKMSTYLLAFIVGDFEWIEKKTKRGVLVRVFTVPGRKEQGRFALECAVRSLDFYEQYFAIRYPLPVLDMIAIPDFASGAMENWGAVTYRDAILIDDENTSLANRQWVAIVVAHELAHQWFGNLVTMEWWTDLWLNEGFASYIEYLAVDTLFPQWSIWSQFLLQDHGPALRLDSLAHTHAIEVEVHHPSEIGEIFDEVSYSKGASVIRMLAEYVGPKQFRDSLRHYLKVHSYKNTQTIHLWESFEKISKKPVKKMMEKWTRTPGYPIISVSERDSMYVLSQKRFFMSPLSEAKAQSTQSWMVPIMLTTNTGSTKPLLMNAKNMKIPALKKPWIKINPGESGLFRVGYEASMLKALQVPIATKELSALDRLGIVRDLFALVESGKQDISVVLDMLASYADETEYIVWGEILSGIGKIARIFENTPHAKEFNAFALGVIQKRAESVGWKKVSGESEDTAFLRSSLLYSAGKYGDVSTVQKAYQIFSDRDERPIDPDLRGAVYALVAENGNEREWDALVEMYTAATLSEEKNRIGRALAHFKSKKLLSQTLAFSLSKDVRSQDAPSLIANVLANTSGIELAWKFIQKNWKELHARYSSGGHMLPRLVSALAFFDDKNKAKEIKAFFKKHSAPGADRTLLQVEEKILLNDAWKKRDGKKIEKWLKAKK